MVTEIQKLNIILNRGKENGINLKEFIKIQIAEFEKSNTYKEMLTGLEYAQNENEIKTKKRYWTDSRGIRRTTKKLANNQLRHPIPRKMKMQKQGYLLKKKMTIKQTLEEGEKENKEYMKYIKDIFNNRMHKMLKRTLGGSIDTGIIWWQPYIDEEGKFKTKLRYGIEMIPMWEDREHENLAAMIIKYPVVYYDKNGKHTFYKIEWWDLEGIRYFIQDGSSFIEDVEAIDEERIIGKDEDGNTMCCHFVLNGKTCLWEKLPFIYWKYNDDEKPLIHYLKSLVDCYDKLTSTIADTIEDMPNAVKVVKNYKSLTTQKDYSNVKLEFIFNKSMITNQSEKITDCKNSEGQVSRKTILANHPFVADIDVEIKELEKEKKEEEKELDAYQNTLNNHTNSKKSK